MIYVVSGHPGSGTSMMMRALIAGGLDPAWCRKREESLKQRFLDEEYRRNGDGFLEIDPDEYETAGFPLAYEGRLIKVLWWGTATLAPHDYRVVFMLRDYEEVAESCRRLMGPRVKMMPLERYEAAMGNSIKRLLARRDVCLSVMHFNCVLAEPRRSFETLRALGWTIDPRVAGEVVKPSLSTVSG